MKPLKVDNRICFGIEYYGTEEQAQQRHQQIQERGDTYNGGFYHGMPCGRDKTYDHEDKNLGKLYAVTVA